MKNLIDFKHLILCYDGEPKQVTFIGPLDFAIEENDFIGLVGESGAGKSTVGLQIQGLLGLKGGRVFAGSMESEINACDVAWIPQDPLSALDPLFSVGALMSEIESDPDLIQQALQQVHLEQVSLKSYPHELSGGMRQRLVIAMALLKRPKVLIADEPTSSLDVVLQHEIMQLFRDIHQKGITCVFITHNLPLAALFCKRVCLMQNGKIVEIGTPYEIMQSPKHEYTKKLVQSIPVFVS